MVKPTPPTAPEAPLRSDPAFSAKAQTFLTWLAGGFYSYVGDSVDYVDERADEALAAATTFGFPSIAGKALNLTRVNAAGTALEFRTPAQVRADLGIISDENLIINGTFPHWQRGTTQSNAGYGSADRWVSDFSGGAVTMSRGAFTVGDTLGSSNAEFYLRQAVSGQSLSTHYAKKTTRIEGVRSCAGQTVTVMFFDRRASGAGNIAVELVQNFGTGGSPSASVFLNPVSITPTGVMGVYRAVFAVPSIAGKTLGTNNNDYLEVNFWTSAGSSFNARTNSLGLQAITNDIWGVNIFYGDVPVSAADQFRPRDKGTELALCQRYLFVTQLGIVLRGHSPSAGAQTFQTIVFPSTMRVAPNATANWVSGTNNASQTVGTSATNALLTVTSSSGSDFAVQYAAGNSFDSEL